MRAGTKCSDQRLRLAPGVEESHQVFRAPQAFRAGQPEGRAPGPIEDEPPVHAHEVAQALDVFDQVGGCVRIARVRPAAAAALIEEHNAVGVEIEVSAPSRGAARARAAVQDDVRLPVRVAAHLPIDELFVPSLQHAVVMRLDLRIQTGHRAPPKGRQGNPLALTPDGVPSTYSVLPRQH
jgi:hypothetical protein